MSKTPFTLPSECLRSDNRYDFLNPETGELRRPMCKANLCPFCGRVKRWKIARAVGASDPSAFLTFTLAGDRWSVTHRRMNKIAERLKRQGHTFKWAWKVECGYTPGGDHSTDHHVHAYVHGDSLPNDVTWAAEAERAGLGPVTHFLVLNDRPTLAPKYLWGRGTKVHEVHPIKHAHVLAMNGGRYVHASRGFWRIDGVPVAGMAEAIRRSRWTSSQALLRVEFSFGN